MALVAYAGVWSSSGAPRACRRVFRPTPSAIALPRISSTEGRTFESSRNCWATRVLPRPRSTLTSRPLACEPRTLPRIHVPGSNPRLGGPAASKAPMQVRPDQIRPDSDTSGGTQANVRAGSAADRRRTIDRRARSGGSRSRADPAAWDAFVARCDPGSYLQTTAWAEVKRPNGWTPVRFMGTTLPGRAAHLSAARASSGALRDGPVVETQPVPDR